jgi:peptide/nickel transport system substrate-binding protein
MNYMNPEVEQLVDVTLPMAVEDPRYEKNIKRLMEIGFNDVPLIPIWQPTLEVAMAPGVEGFVNWFHRQLDIRSFTKK